MNIVFGSDPFTPRAPDPSYREEYEAAKQSGLNVHVVSVESLFEEKNAERAVRWIDKYPSVKPALFRGFMLTEDDYRAIYEALLVKNLRLVNSPDQYAFCHYLPVGFDAIRRYTPKSRWFESGTDLDENALRHVLGDFGSKPVIVKDYVKSEKHYWTEACFIPDASDFDVAARVVRRFLELRGQFLNRGLVIREYVPLAQSGAGQDHGVPLSVEARLFFLLGKRMLTVPYWQADGKLPDDAELQDLLLCTPNIHSDFFTVDAAQKTDGEWIIMELGDGQVAGLPDGLAPDRFYREIVAVCG